MLQELPTGFSDTALLTRLLGNARSSLVQAIGAPVLITPTVNRAGNSSVLSRFLHSHLSDLPHHVEKLLTLGIQSVVLYAVAESRSNSARESYSSQGLVQRAIRTLKREFPELVVLSDVGLCQYTATGHCGAVIGSHIANDASVSIAEKQALSHANAGSDAVIPSIMMDGVVKRIRNTLDSQNFKHIPIFAQAMKFASSLYQPFRNDTSGAPIIPDKRSYQIDPACKTQAIREARLDLEEGAAMLIVKPTFGYLDILRSVKHELRAPTAAFCTSGEYLLCLRRAESLREDPAIAWTRYLERIQDAGADYIISYGAELLRHAARKDG